MIRFAKLPLSFDLDLMKAELSALPTDWQEHFNTYYYEGSWTVLALRSPGGSDKNIIPDVMGGGEYENAPMMQNFPSVQKLLAAIECPVMSVRFLNLKAGAVIKKHRDPELAFEKGEARLHFPVITNPDVKFNIEEERIPLQAGDCWYLNANLPHQVANEGTIDRIHLVIDCTVNNWLKNIMAQAEQVSVKEKKPDQNRLNIIEELRRQNTETSNKLADEMGKQTEG